METSTIIILVVVGILVLAGLGVGGYFLFRKKESTWSDSTNIGDTIVGGRTGAGNTGGQSGNTDYGGTTGDEIGFEGASGGNTPVQINGNFSIVHGKFKTKTMTKSTTTDEVIMSDLKTIPCSSFEIRNAPTQDYDTASRKIEMGLEIPTLQSILMANADTGYLRFSRRNIQFANNVILTPDLTTWLYHPTNKTWCGGTNQEMLSRLCLYYSGTGNVELKRYDPGDDNFKWDNVSVLAPPKCTLPPTILPPTPPTSV